MSKVTTVRSLTKSMGVSGRRALAVAAASVMGFGSPAYAAVSEGGLFVEPTITFELGNSFVNYPAPISNSEGTVDGFGLGARVGGHISEIVFAGLDARIAMPQFKDSTVDYDAAALSTNWGPVVGVQMPVLGMRVWGTYVLGGELDPEKSSGLDVKFSGAKGYRVGAGFRFLMVSLNLEYQELTYDETNLESVGPFATNANLGGVELENKSWIAGVSFPLEL
jgi:hypothetical protein